MPRHARPVRRTPTPKARGRWAGLALGLAAITAISTISGASTELQTSAASRACPDGTSNQSTVVRVNIGGPAVTVDDRIWSADPTAAPDGPSIPASQNIRGTRADVLYQTWHSGEFRFEAPVPERGRYVTRLHFIEPDAAEGRVQRGSRVFTVNLEGGRPELRRFDIAAQTRGKLRAVVTRHSTFVRDGSLTIEGRSIVGQPVLSAVEVLRQHPRGTCVPEESSVPAPGPAENAEPAENAGSAESGSPPPAPEDQGGATETAPETEQGALDQDVPAQPSPAPSTPAPVEAPASSDATVGQLTATGGRPFSPASAWNTPLPANPAIDPRSAAMVRSVAPTNRATANLYAYADPVFTADARTPTATVDCTENWGTCDLERRPIRIPADARPTTGSDGRMIVVDLVEGVSCDFWQARRVSSSHWSTSWGTCAPLDGDGRGPSGGATGAGVNALVGVVRTFEIRNEYIPHALSIATNNSCARVFRAPAVKTDGQSTRSDCIPEGARLQLDPSIDVDAIPGITPGERAVARALQVYGAINRDNCGSNICVAFEAPFGQADPYPAAGFDGDYYTMPHIPWTQLRVIAE